MNVCRKQLSAGVITSFAFADFANPFVLVKNESDGEILFCDEQFSEVDAVHIPARSWQKLFVKLFIGKSPCFYVRSEVAGFVEIDMGSDGMGPLDVMAMLNKSGFIPHGLTFSNGEGTTIDASLQREHGDSIDLQVPVSLVSGSTVFSGDVVKFTVGCSVAGQHAVLTVNGLEVAVAQDGTCTYVIDGDTTASTTAVAD